MATKSAHPHPRARIAFIIVNSVLLIAAILIFVLFVFVVKDFKFNNVLAIFLFIISLVVVFLSISGIIGARYGPKGKEGYLTFLLIYYFILFVLLVVIFIVGMFYAFSSNIISQSIETFGDSLEENLQIWLSTLGPFAEFFYILTGNTMLIGVGIALLAIIILLGLILSAYLIGYRHFIKANLIFGSIFIVLSGILITVMSIIFRDQLNIGADLASFGWILLALGIVIAVIALGGTACGFVPNKCFVGLNFYVILLLVLMGVLVVFGLVILVFPGLFWETMVEALSEDCESTSEKGYAETCQEQMKLYFNLMCNTTQEQIDKYKGQFAVKGECSYADIKDRIVNNLIQGILSNLNLIAFASILISVIFLYVVIIVLVALNSNWEGTGAMRVDLTTAKQKVHRD